MIRVRITRQTVALKRNVRVGEVLDLPDADARQLLGSGKAVKAEAAAEPAVQAKPAPKRTTRQLSLKRQTS